MLRKMLFLATFIAYFTACGAQSEMTASTKDDLITVCLSGPCTTTAQPPATSTFMWQPSYRIYPMETNMRFCDIRWPPGLGEINIYDLPFAQDSTGQWYPQSTSQCATIKDNQNGVLTNGWFDWIAFQDFGWATPTGSIRALQLGPGMKAIFSDRPLDVSRPDGCAIPSTCIGVGGEAQIVRSVPDVRAIFPGFPTFYMASLHIQRQ